jgi:diguanylate cyclase (GGDEF)-like protein
MAVVLDGFKPVNDQLAQRLTNCTRSTDTVARHGGDEFAILIEPDHPRDTDIVGRVAQALAEPFAITGHELRVDASIGRATFPADAHDAESLPRRADAAMFTTKRARHQPVRSRYKSLTSSGIVLRPARSAKR